MRFGVLAEGVTDCEAIGVLVQRIAQMDAQLTVGITPRSFKGCSGLRKKMHPHLVAIANDCAGAIVVHDLDRNNATNTLNSESSLRQQLTSKLPTNTGLQHLICIPVEELEAWFWCDQRVLDTIAKGEKAHANPHLIPKPKEALRDASRGANRVPRYSTNENRVLAELLDIDLCARKCPAFADLRGFVGAIAIAHAAQNITSASVTPRPHSKKQRRRGHK